MGKQCRRSRSKLSFIVIQRLWNQFLREFTVSRQSFIRSSPWHFLLQLQDNNTRRCSRLLLIILHQRKNSNRFYFRKRLHVHGLFAIRLAISITLTHSDKTEIQMGRRTNTSRREFSDPQYSLQISLNILHSVNYIIIGWEQETWYIN